MTLEQWLLVINTHPVLVSTLIAWSLIWKGLALWQAARRHERYWFIALLIINTVGILELIYLGFVAKVLLPGAGRGDKELRG